MDHFEFVALKAKVETANRYLEQVMTHRKIDNYDIRKVVTRSMLETGRIEIMPMEQAKYDGLGVVRFKEAI